MCWKFKQILPQISKFGCQSLILQSVMPNEIKETTSSAIKVLKKVALKNKVVSLSANQIDLQQRFFVCLKNQFLIPGRWHNYDHIRNQDQYQAIVNPQNLMANNQNLYAFQQCPTFVGFRFLVWAPTIIKLSYACETNFNKIINTTVRGFQSRVWQHEIRHLDGELPINQEVCRGQFFLMDQYKNTYQFVDFYNKIKKQSKLFSQNSLKEIQREFKKQVKQRTISKEQGLSNFQKIHRQLNMTIPIETNSQRKSKKNLKMEQELNIQKQNIYEEENLNFTNFKKETVSDFKENKKQKNYSKKLKEKK